MLALLALAATSLAAQEPKVPFVTAYPGSRLPGPVKVSEYHEYELLVGPVGANAKTEKVAGKVTRIFLLGPKNRSLLEVFANYEEALRKDGFATIFRCAGKGCGSGKTKELESSFNQTVEQYYLAAKKSTPGGPIYAALMVNDKYNPAARLNVIEVRPMQSGLVKVTADQMSSDLARTGRVVLYSILFDSGKADIKPESNETIAEIAKFLAANAGVKIHVVGHTDNVGTYESNADLSKRRADAVVKVLTATHGIGATRLRAVGVASVAPVATNRTEDGRRLNRRVELVEQ
jgi:outer membrane protein OmpA-like peptidoglycan-associated protein